MKLKDAYSLEGKLWPTKSRDISLPTKVCLVKAMVFPVVMYGSESWTIKKAECRRIDAFELWCWRRLLRVPCTARGSNQSILKEIDRSWVFIGGTDAEAETPILWSPVAKSQLFGKDPDAVKNGGQEGKRATEDQMVAWYHCLNWHEFEQTLGDNEGQGRLACCSSWGCRVRHDLVTEQQTFQSGQAQSRLVALKMVENRLLWEFQN